MTDQTKKPVRDSLALIPERWLKLLELYSEVYQPDGHIDYNRLDLELGETVKYGKEHSGKSWYSGKGAPPIKPAKLAAEVHYAIYDPSEEGFRSNLRFEIKSNPHILPRLAIGLVVDVRLTEFTPSLSGILPEELELLNTKGIHSGFDFIDFWLVDFDYLPEHPFKVNWRAFKKTNNQSVPTITDRHFLYQRNEQHLICVKVVDIFGVETSCVLEASID